MWDAGMPQADRPDAGFPQLESAVHVPIFEPTKEEGAYNHHPSVAFHHGRFHAFWSNHSAGEDGPGERVLYSQSTDGRAWTEPQVLFQPPGPERDKEHPAVWQRVEPTDIPDSPSLSCGLSADDGTVLLIGNQCAPEFDNPDEVQHYDRMPLTVAVSRDGRRFTRALTIRTGTHDWLVPQSEVGGRSPGYQYPDACIVNDRLWATHSIGKERIAVSSVDMREIAGLKEPSQT